MRAQTFWKTVTADRSDFLGRLIALLADHDIRYCVVGGQGVNAYAEPVVSLDLDLAVKRQKDLADIARLLETHPSLRERVPPEVLARLV